MVRFLLRFVMFLLRLLPLLIVYIALYQDAGHHRLQKAGIREKDITVGDVRFHYAESEGQGKPAILLLHAQFLDWFSYQYVIIPLSKYFHVFALDCPGHGKTECPDDYEMNAEQIGSSVAQFIEEVIGRPAAVSGNSAGGLIAVWLGANRPELVTKLILEDPPLFSSEYPAIKWTIAYRIFAVSDMAVREDHEGDYVRFLIKNAPESYWNHTFPAARILISVLVAVYRMLHWQKTAEIPFVSPIVREMIRGMDRYDPHFGKAFYDGTWNENFDHADALRRIACPVLLMQADTSFLQDGTLNGAMSEENAQFACSRLQHVSFVKVSAGYAVHLEAPEEYMNHVRKFYAE